MKLSEIELCSSPLCFIQNLRQIYARDSHGKFPKKQEANNTTWAKLRKMTGSFEKIESLDSTLQGIPSGAENQVRVTFFVFLG